MGVVENFKHTNSTREKAKKFNPNDVRLGCKRFLYPLLSFLMIQWMWVIC